MSLRIWFKPDVEVVAEDTLRFEILLNNFYKFSSYII